MVYCFPVAALHVKETWLGGASWVSSHGMGWEARDLATQGWREHQPEACVVSPKR